MKSPDKSNPNIKRVENYKDSIMYRLIQSYFEEKNFRGVLDNMQSMSLNPLMDKKHFNMMEILVQAYEGGDHSQKLVDQLKKTVEDFFQELVDKNLIHTSKWTVEGIDPSSNE